MPEKKHRKPFEDHINSESFDVSNLGSVRERSALEQDMDEFFNNLPSEQGHKLWDNELDTRQKEISAYLTTELAERILRDEHGDLLDDFSDAELISILTVPVTLAMLAEERLHQIEKVEVEHPLLSDKLEYQENFPQVPQSWRITLQEWFLKANDFLRNLFRR